MSAAHDNDPDLAAAIKASEESYKNEVAKRENNKPRYAKEEADRKTRTETSHHAVLSGSTQSAAAPAQVISAAAAQIVSVAAAPVVSAVTPAKANQSNQAHQANEANQANQANAANNGAIVTKAESFEKELNEIRKLEDEVDELEKAVNEYAIPGVEKAQADVDAFYAERDSLKSEAESNKADANLAKDIMQIYDPHKYEIELIHARGAWERAHQAHLRAIGTSKVAVAKIVYESALDEYNHARDVLAKQKKEHAAKKKEYDALQAKYERAHTRYWGHEKNWAGIVSKRDTGCRLLEKDQKTLTTMKKRLEQLKADLIVKQGLAKKAELLIHKPQLDSAIKEFTAALESTAKIVSDIRKDKGAMLEKLQKLESESFERIKWFKEFITANDLPLDVPGGISKNNLAQFCQKEHQNLKAEVEKLAKEFENLKSTLDKDKATFSGSVNKVAEIRKTVLGIVEDIRKNQHTNATDDADECEKQIADIFVQPSWYAEIFAENDKFIFWNDLNNAFDALRKKLDDKAFAEVFALITETPDDAAGNNPDTSAAAQAAPTGSAKPLSGPGGATPNPSSGTDSKSGADSNSSDGKAGSGGQPPLAYLYVSYNNGPSEAELASKRFEEDKKKNQEFLFRMIQEYLYRKYEEDIKKKKAEKEARLEKEKAELKARQEKARLETQALRAAEALRYQQDEARRQAARALREAEEERQAEVRRQQASSYSRNYQYSYR